MDNFTIHTDLACESEIMHDANKSGTDFSEKRCRGFTVARLSVKNELGERASGKKIGEYITVFSDLLCDIESERFSKLTAVVSEEISSLIRSSLKKDPSCVLVVGLGNREITADNIGPRAVDRLTVTRHLMHHNKTLFDSYWSTPLCAIAPGVLGQTGIETAEIINGVCSLASPDVIIAIDALAARSTERLGRTVQISDSGIHPGSGIGNRRSEISLATVGVPVISVGVPTVVNSATLVYDALTSAGYKNIEKDLLSVLKSGESFFVSPRQSDLISDSASELISGAIDMLFLKQGD